MSLFQKASLPNKGASSCGSHVAVPAATVDTTDMKTASGDAYAKAISLLIWMGYSPIFPQCDQGHKMCELPQFSTFYILLNNFKETRCSIGSWTQSKTRMLMNRNVRKARMYYLLTQEPLTLMFSTIPREKNPHLILVIGSCNYLINNLSQVTQSEYGKGETTVGKTLLYPACFWNPVSSLIQRRRNSLQKFYIHSTCFLALKTESQAHSRSGYKNAEANAFLCNP